MNKLKYGSYEYKMEIPVEVIYSHRDDGSISIDMINVSSENELYRIVDEHAHSIREGAKKGG